MRFLHFNKPAVQEYMEKLQKRFTRSIRSTMRPLHFDSLSTLLKQAQSTTTTTNEILSMVDLETIPTQSATTTTPIQTLPRAVLDKKLFTCPITLDIMDNPVTTTPCGHMFDMDAITPYLNRFGNACPTCRTVITGVTPNYAFKNVIEAWVAQQME